MRLIEKGARVADAYIADFVDLEKWAAMLETAGPGFTLFRGPKIVGCGGVFVHEEHAEAWLIIADGAERYKKTVFRVVKTTLDGIVRELNIHKLTAHAETKDTQAQAFLYVLGFNVAGGSLKFAGKRYLTYERVN